MIIKKFQGKTENEAVEAAKSELGANVVIMNTRNVKKKGLFSFFRSPIVEITVGLEEDNDNNNLNAKKISEAIGKIAPIVEQAEKDRDNKTLVEAMGATDKTNAVIEEKLENIQSLIEEKLQKTDENRDKSDKRFHDALKEAQREEEKDETSKPDSSESDELTVFLDLLKATMLDNEVDEDIADSIIDETVKITKPGTPFDVALASIYQKMILKFGKPSTISCAESGPKAIFFIGPTGVGKTTTIAKLASKFRVEEKKKVALLTADTYRIAAAEQLKTYASILEVPFRIIYTIDEMEEAIKDFKDYDYIFVDTAGHSHQNNEQKNIMGDFIHSVDELTEKEIYLVVSATTKYRDLKSIADAYSEITSYKLIFTKLDETTAFGNLLNLKLYTDAELSYVTCGQNVPDDIEEFNAQRTVKCLLGGKK